MNTILCNYGYVINKSIILNRLDKIKNDLNVIPFSINNNFYNNNKFKVYSENNKQIMCSSIYGIKNFV